jgi:hypothetical protein
MGAKDPMRKAILARFWSDFYKVNHLIIWYGGFGLPNKTRELNYLIPMVRVQLDELKVPKADFNWRRFFAHR